LRFEERFALGLRLKSRMFRPLTSNLKPFAAEGEPIFLLSQRVFDGLDPATR